MVNVDVQKLKNDIEDIRKLIQLNSFEIKNIKFVEEFDREELYKKADVEWKDFRIGDRWGVKDKIFWFKIEVKIPEEVKGKKVVLYISLAGKGSLFRECPESLIYINGIPVQGLDKYHQEVILNQNAKGGEVYHIHIKAFSGLTSQKHIFQKARCCAIDIETEDLYYNAKVAYDSARCFDEHNSERIKILQILNKTFLLIDYRDLKSTSFYASVKKANQYLKENLGKFSVSKDREKITFAGHAHIDVGWLWQYKHSREKVSRTFSTILNLMKEYPEFKFTQSQPQLYEYLKEDYPEIYKEIKKRIKEGRWEPTGGMWVEPDCNLPSGESLIRQFLFGMRFFKKEFNKTPKILWCPDSFGYSWALPQIIKGCGLEYFLTAKMSWNYYNRFPNDTFIWQGIDGSKVLAYCITTPIDERFLTTYNGVISPENVKGCWNGYRQKEINDEVLFLFGYGDGGGGPTREMIETGKRLKDFPGMPGCVFDCAEPFFERLKKQVTGSSKLPVWNDELYLEDHQGTYTSQAQNKRYNRKSEINYQTTEFLSSLSFIHGGKYSQDKINEGWKLILLNQFHDVLPGSSINEVYQDSQKDYEKVLDISEKCCNEAVEKITEKIKLKDESIVVFNTLPWSRDDLIYIDIDAIPKGKVLFDAENKSILTQREDNKVICYLTGINPSGYKSFHLKKVQNTKNTLIKNTIKVTKKYMENKFFKITFSSKGNIISILDKINKREVVEKGKDANAFQAFEDKPIATDAWDINPFYQDKMWVIDDLESMEVIDKGPVVGTLKLTRCFSKSKIIQKIKIYSEVPRIDFDTWIDWKDSQILLKAAFPVNIHSNKAVFDIQFGNIERPTHWNTSWDYGKFEVWGHKWVDLSEGDYGVSLLNDCKYGYDVKDNQIRITLIKSPIYPDKEADKRIHKFIYSLYPHKGNWREGKTVQMAYQLNSHLVAKYAAQGNGKMGDSFSIARIDRENVILETIKKAEDSQDLILRLYECYNQRGKVKVELWKEPQNIFECNLLEEEKKEVKFSGNEFNFYTTPYEIKTFMVKF